MCGEELGVQRPFHETIAVVLRAVGGLQQSKIATITVGPDGATAEVLHGDALQRIPQNHRRQPQGLLRTGKFPTGGRVWLQPAALDGRHDVCCTMPAGTGQGRGNHPVHVLRRPHQELMAL